MRLRNVPGSRDAIEESSFVFTDPDAISGTWNEIFVNDNPLHIEIGMGKGRFITEMAGINTDINYVGIEKYSSVLLRALEKQNQLLMPNLRFIRMDAENITDVFGEHEVSRIYLNFSDPWPKDRHAKRRLTSRQFLERYDYILADNGELHFKTDNVALFDWSLEEIAGAGWHVMVMTRDLHNDAAMNAGNVMTEYEDKFSGRGNPIYKLVAVRGGAAGRIL